jgi:hypothetical protein
MTNISMEREGDILTIKVNMTENHGPSKSGKTVIIATTSGAHPIPGNEGASLNLNVYRSK